MKYAIWSFGSCNDRDNQRIPNKHFITFEADEEVSIW